MTDIWGKLDHALEYWCLLPPEESKNTVRKKWILLFSKEALNWSKVTAKSFIMLQKILFQIKAVFTLYLSKNPENKMQKCEVPKLFSTLIISQLFKILE